MQTKRRTHIEPKKVKKLQFLKYDYLVVLGIECDLHEIVQVVTDIQSDQETDNQWSKDVLEMALLIGKSLHKWFTFMVENGNTEHGHELIQEHHGVSECWFEFFLIVDLKVIIVTVFS